MLDGFGPVRAGRGIQDGQSFASRSCVKAIERIDRFVPRLLFSFFGFLGVVEDCRFATGLRNTFRAFSRTGWKFLAPKSRSPQ